MALEVCTSGELQSPSVKVDQPRDATLDFQEQPSKLVDIFCCLHVNVYIQDHSFRNGEILASVTAVQLGVVWTIRARMRWICVRRHAFCISLKPRIICQMCATRFTSRAVSPLPFTSCSASQNQSLSTQSCLFPASCMASSSIFPVL